MRKVSYRARNSFNSPLNEFSLYGNKKAAGPGDMYFVFIANKTGSGIVPTDVTFIPSTANFSSATYSHTTSPSPLYYNDATVTAWYNSDLPHVNDVTYPVGWAVFEANKNLLGRTTCWNSVKVLGTAGNSNDNAPLRQLISIYCNLIRANWGTTVPEYIDCAMDEFVQMDQNDQLKHIVKGDKSSNRQENPEVLIANHIKEVFGIIEGIFPTPSSRPKMMLWADCFLPHFNGDAKPISLNPQNEVDRKLCGDINTGVDGILYNLTTYRDRLLIRPWAYDNTNGGYYDKRIWCKYLNNLGFSFVPFGGEGCYFNVVNGIWYCLLDAPKHSNSMQCTFEWAVEAAKYPDKCKGLGLATWIMKCTGDPLTSNAGYSYHAQNLAIDNLQSNFMAPVISYLLKYPYVATSINQDENVPFTYDLQNNKYGVFEGVDFIASRNAMDWRKGVHYTTGLGLRAIGTASNVDGEWIPKYTDYKLYGRSYTDQNNQAPESGFCYAFAKKSNFDFRVKPSTFTNVKDAGILIRGAITQNVNDCPYIFFYISSNSINTARIKYRNSTGNIITETILGTGPFLKATKMNINTINLYSGSGNGNYTLLKSYDNILSGNVFIGMASTSLSTDPSTNVVFSNVAFKEVDITPILNLLLGD